MTAAAAPAAVVEVTEHCTEAAKAIVGAPSTSSLIDTARALVAGDKGLLAIDESIPTCNRRFARLGITQDELTRRACRELIITTPGLAECINGVILCDETIRQRTTDGVRFLSVLADAGIMAEIKVDIGAKRLAGHPTEKVTEGLDGLRERLAEYAAIGARFAKWRAVFTIGDTTPSEACMLANAHALAHYAALCQEAGLVPIVEPEAAVAGIAFLSGGQSGDLASSHLNAINAPDELPLPWPVAFSCGRATSSPP